jgi:hypothetical protein
MGLSHRIQKWRRLLEKGTPHHLTLCSLERRTKPNFLAQTKEHNLSRFKNYRPGSMRNEETCAYFSRPSSESAQRTYVVEELTTLIIASSRTGRANP